MSGDAVQIVVDAEMSLGIAAAAFTVCAFLIVLLFKVVLAGLNKTITSCHSSLTKEHEHLLEKHINHEERIKNIEVAIFRPVGGRHD